MSAFSTKDNARGECSTTRDLLEQPQIAHPFLHANVPRAEWNAVTEMNRLAVAAVRVDVQLDRDANLKQRVIEFDGLPGVRGVVLAGAGQKRGRRIGRSRDVH